jgi:protein-disulfide isomerase
MSEVNTTQQPKNPKAQKASLYTAPSPRAITRIYKIWAISATVTALILAIATVILVVALAISGGDTRRLESKPADTSVETDISGDNSEVDINGLDGSQLITQADLEADEIPDHYVGKRSNAQVVVIEYEDFACSHCQDLHQYAEQIHADYGDRVLFIHRSFSLSFPNSDKTLSAAEAAYQLGGEEAYWAMSRLLYQDTQWTGNEVFGGQSVLNGYAKQIGLDGDKFEKAMSDAAVMNKISRDKELGKKANVAGTPTWFVNGRQVNPTDSDIRAALDATL